MNSILNLADTTTKAFLMLFTTWWELAKYILNSFNSPLVILIPELEKYCWKLLLETDIRTWYPSHQKNPSWAQVRQESLQKMTAQTFPRAVTNLQQIAKLINRIQTLVKNRNFHSKAQNQKPLQLVYLRNLQMNRNLNYQAKTRLHQ